MLELLKSTVSLNLLSKTIHKSMGWFLFLVLCFLLSHFPSQTSSLVPSCNHDEASALLSFKSSFTLNSSSHSSLWCEYPKTESWENGRNCCLWDGVSCDTKSGHVIGLDLSCSCLQGQFHPNTTLFKLIHLQKLNLAFNDFSNSPMPNGFADHLPLTHLNLSASAFSGVIPSKISHLSKLVSLDLSFLGMRIEAATLENVVVNATDIRELTLDGLDLSSIKPSCLSLLVNFSSSLVSLSLRETGLEGKLANNILCLPNLQKLDLSSNMFLEGELPEFNRSTPLRYLDLYNTGFSGKLPNSINHLESLNYLDFKASNFEGPIPLFLSNLTQLKHLDLGWNNFSGEIPSSLSNLQHLTFLDLSVNSFTGPIAQCFGNITQVNHLDLGENYFNGEIPSSLSNLQHLTLIILSHNSFTGHIPQCFGNITQVNHLDLGGNNFGGEIPSSLSNLQHLTVLDLSDNNFGGEIPDLFDKFTKLEELYLFGNKLMGQLPSSLFGLTQLRYLSCSDNKLVGPIPEKISGFSNLISLDLSSNSLNGTIPQWCFSLSSLSSLSLRGNQLTWPVGEFSSFSLQYCDLSYNTLQGNIPNSMFHLQNLDMLILSSNNLSGHLEFHKFSNMQFLQNLLLSDNNFLYLSFNSTGGDYTFPNLRYLNLSSCNVNSIPKFLRGLKNLESLDLSRNQIHGRIPKWFNSTGKNTLSFLDLSHNLLTSVGYLSLSWATMQYIDLSFNMLQGDIPIPPSGTEFFSVSNNKLTGHISSTICNASSLQMLDLSHNNLTGKLPQCIGTFPYLSVMDLHRNNLNGMIPKTYLEIEALETMNFNGNQLKGALPRSVVKCKQLRVLDLGENNMQDTFPTFLESLQKLQILVLRANGFNGTINCLKMKNDFPMLRVFDISNNNFSGNFPTACIKAFKGMMVNVDNGLHYMKGNNDSLGYYDSVVITIKGNIYELERILTTFTTIDLSNNRFGGVIPAIIGELKSLKGLNLSHNRITGVIPQNIGGLENLEWLDLSSNMLMGEIPKALTNLHFLSSLNLSQNQLVGMIPTGKQFDTFQNDSYEGNQGLCGLPLSKSCQNDEKQPTYSTTFEDDEEFRFGWKPVAIGYACGGVFGILLGYIVFFQRKPEWSISLVEGILNPRVRKKSNRSNANTRQYNQGR